MGSDPVSQLGLAGVMALAFLAWGYGKLERSAFNKIFYRFFDLSQDTMDMLNNGVSLVTFLTRLLLIYAIWLYARNDAFSADKTEYWVAVNFALWALGIEFFVNYILNAFIVSGPWGLKFRETIVAALVLAIGIFYLFSLIYSTRNHPRNPRFDAALNTTVYYQDEHVHTATYFEVIIGMFACVWTLQAVARFFFVIMSCMKDDDYWAHFANNDGAIRIQTTAEEQGLTTAYE